MFLAQNKSLFVNLALVLVAFAYTYRLVAHRIEVFGIGTTHSSVNTTGCYTFGEELDHVQGCEDIRVDPRTGLGYMACGNRRARTRWLHTNAVYNPSFEQFKDHVLVVDEKNNVISLDIVEKSSSGTLVPFKQDLRLHGFDIYWDDVSPDELTFMFVNHQRAGHAVSIFKHRVGTSYIEHVETVRSPLIRSPNSILAVSRRAFYVTNDLRYLGGKLRKIEEFFGMPWGNVVYHGDEGLVSIAYSGLSYPNGIARSPDHSLVYVACSSEPSVRTFRPSDDGSLELVSKTKFKAFVPDNLSVDAHTGQVIVAGKYRAFAASHSLCRFLNTFEMFRYNREVLHGTAARPASSIRRLTPSSDPRKGLKVESILVDGGDLLPSTTVGAVQRRNGVKRLVLGAVMADRIAICGS
ncbi:hypothetical protein GGI12_003740 [Dipsacomyces acuminosporus]|nr:hypothetical protein GGI12_003740 [Dipsacomyces acuminosporus]